jgi:hypothetical protein
MSHFLWACPIRRGSYTLSRLNRWIRQRYWLQRMGAIL